MNIELSDKIVEISREKELEILTERLGMSRLDALEMQAIERGESDGDVIVIDRMPKAKLKSKQLN